MMAKMFYTLDETKAALGKSEDEIKQYSKEGRLREFRDGQRLMFKADQVDQLRTELTTGGTSADLGPSDSAAGVNLADNMAPSGSGMVSLADTDFGKNSGAAAMKDDTRLSEDLGLSGSIGGIPSPSRSSAGSGLAGSTAGSKAGITVFDVDDAHRADPSAQTSAGGGSGTGIHEPPLEGVGSGSGLLDLARDRDDTSLGAEVLDEISPSSGGGSARRASPSSADSAVDLEAAFEPQGRGGVTRTALSAPVYVEQHDASATAFGALALFGAIVVVFGAYVLVNAVSGVRPDLIKDFSAPSPNSKGAIYLIGAIVGGAIFFAIGWFFGKATPNRR